MRNPMLTAMSPGLPHRDAWLLPLISLATVFMLLAGAELVSRVVSPEQVFNVCRTPDPQMTFHYFPNCASTMKTPEGPWVTKKYNNCGYRSVASCGPVPVRTRRVALIGSSLSEGYMVEYPNSIGGRLDVDLTRLCDAPVEVQSLGAMGYSGPLLLPRMQEALHLRPDAVVLVLAPFDMEYEVGDSPPPLDGQANGPGGLLKRIFDTPKVSRSLIVAQHFLFQNPLIYLPLYLRYGDKADFLRPPFSPRWQARLRTVDALIATFVAQAHQAGVPFIFAFVPQEVQVALMAGRVVPPGINPAALSIVLQDIVARHGVWFPDISVALRAEHAPERLYYQVDGHLSGQEQSVATAYIAQQLAAKPDDPFGACRCLVSIQSGTDR